MNTHELSKTKNFNSELKLKGFAVYEIDSEGNTGYTYSRKDFYKVNLTTGKFVFRYADKSVETDDTFLFCANPHIPYFLTFHILVNHFRQTLQATRVFFQKSFWS